MTEDLTSSTHPPLPPTTEEARFDWLRLLRSRRVGIATFYRLMREHGTAKRALEVLPEVARAAGVSDYEICPEGVIHAELRAARMAKARLLCIGDPAYSALLAQTSDAPPLLWTLGDIQQMARPTIALVGARNASSLGQRMAKKLAQDLGDAGFVIVSGLARGIDTAAHNASLTSGTIAVQAGGVDVIYPTENKELSGQIATQGLRVSEQPMGLSPQARHFPARNRIISGLCSAVVVIEAAHRSGSLITAQSALTQGRDVLAVPGHPFDGRAGGCNALIRDGATLIRSAQDIIDAIAPVAPPAPVQSEAAKTQPQVGNQARLNLKQSAALHQRILTKLSPAPMAEDQLIRDLAIEPKNVAPALVALELAGKVLRLSGGLVSRAD